MTRSDGTPPTLGRERIEVVGLGYVGLCDVRVGVLGLTFKENVTVLRYSRVPDIVAELTSFGAAALEHDPIAVSDEARHEYGIELQSREALADLDAIVLAVAHRSYPSRVLTDTTRVLCTHGVAIDVRAALDPTELPPGLQ